MEQVLGPRHPDTLPPAPKSRAVRGRLCGHRDVTSPGSATSALLWTPGAGKLRHDRATFSACLDLIGYSADIAGNHRW